MLSFEHIWWLLQNTRHPRGNIFNAFLQELLEHISAGKRICLEYAFPDEKGRGLSCGKAHPEKVLISGRTHLENVLCGKAHSYRFHRRDKFPAGRHLNVPSGKTRVYGAASVLVQTCAEFTLRFAARESFDCNSSVSCI